jgi:hypothetical protein
MRLEKRLFDLGWSLHTHWFKATVHWLCRDRSPLDFLKVVGQLRGCINLARGKKLSTMVQINRGEDFRASSSRFL